MPKELIKRGWGIDLPEGSRRKFCYYIDGMSLCGRWGFYRGELKDSGDEHPENCQTCLKKLNKTIRSCDQ